MAALSNPVNAENIVSRFHDYVRASAQSGVTWGTNNLPVYAPGTPWETTVIPATAMGGPNNGDPGAGAFIGDAVPGAVINGYNIYNYLNFFTYEYCYIRNVRALLTVTGDGGNLGNYPEPGDVYDVTRVAYFSNRSTQAGQVADFAGPTPGGVSANQVISATEMENFLARCRASYINFARNQTYIYNPIVCHASCHSSCHGSRGRR
jgi:hypothetical protein